MSQIAEHSILNLFILLQDSNDMSGSSNFPVVIGYLRHWKLLHPHVCINIKHGYAHG